MLDSWALVPPSHLCFQTTRVAGDARGEDLTATKAAEWRQDSQPEPFETTKTMAARPVVEALAKGQIMKRSSGRLGALLPLLSSAQGPRAAWLSSPIACPGAEQADIRVGVAGLQTTTALQRQWAAR